MLTRCTKCTRQINANPVVYCLATPKHERQDIAARKEALTQWSNGEEVHLVKLRTLKTGLMQDLLTGKVRVKVDESDEAMPNV